MNIKLINFTTMIKEIYVGFLNLKTSQNGKIDYKNYIITKEDYILNCIKALLVVLTISFTFYGNFLISIFFLPIILIYPFFLKKYYAEKRKDKLILEFKDMINILNSYLDAGYSCENAFVATKNDIRKLYKKESYIEIELNYICKYIALNKPIEIALKDFSYRSGIDDIVDFSEVFILAKKSGGHLHRIIGNTIKTIRDKIQISMDIKNKTSEKRFEQSIMNLIPFFIIIYLNVTSKGLLEVMYNTIIGKLIMTILLLVYIIAFYISKRILEIEV